MLREFLRDLLLLEPQWVDQGQGRYVKKRKLRGGAKLAIGAAIALVLAVGAGFLLDVFTGKGPEGKTPEKVLAAQAPRLDVVREPEPRPERPEGNETNSPLAMVPEGVEPAPQPAPEPVVTVTTTPAEDAPRPTVKATARRTNPNANPADDDYWIRVSKGDYTLFLYHGDELVRTYSVAVGENPGDKQYVGDHRTPNGDFRVVSIENSTKWKHDFRDGKGPIAGAYGPWFIRLDTGRWKGIGIHGTHDPDSRGTMASEGCIRMLNEDIQELRRYAFRNMRVVIEE